MPEYSSVKVIIKTGDVEVVYDIPMVENFEMDTKFDEPEIREDLKATRHYDVTVTRLAFIMVPKSNDEDTYMTITRTATAKKVNCKDGSNGLY